MPRRVVWDQAADMHVRVSWEADGDCSVGRMAEGKSLTRVKFET